MMATMIVKVEVVVKALTGMGAISIVVQKDLLVFDRAP
jgi:hypothetical protein